MTQLVKRIYIFDFLRGIAIFGVVLLHTMQHQWQNTEAVASGAQETTPMLRFLYYILTMAGLFYIVMGSVNGFMIYNRLISGRNYPKQLIQSGFIMGFVLILLHYFFRWLLSADSGLIYFLIDTGNAPQNVLYYLVVTSTLAMLGWTSIIVALLLSLLIKSEMAELNDVSKPKIDEDFKHLDREATNRIYWKLGVLSFTILITTPIIRYWLIPYVENAIENGNVAFAIFLGWIVYIRFPIFPYGSYGLIGAILGIALAQDENHKRIRNYLVGLGALLMLVGFSGNYYFGGLEPVYYDDFSWKGILNITFMEYSQVGGFLVFIWVGLWFFDFVPERIHEKRTKFFSGLRRFSMISLTMFLFESLLTLLLVKIMDKIPAFNGWHENLGTVALFGLFSILVWAGLARIWEKHNYVGTVEWVLIKLVEIISGKKSEKYNLDRLKKSENR